MSIEIFDRDKINWQALLHQILEREGVEAVMCVVCVDGRWHSCWSSETAEGKAMAAMKLFNDVLIDMHEE
jgi:sulfur relay (sulfurtransferase) complex TusBCD TusD component (DsrE family)